MRNGRGTFDDNVPEFLMVSGARYSCRRQPAYTKSNANNSMDVQECRIMSMFALRAY